MDVRQLTLSDLDDYKHIRLEALQAAPTAFSSSYDVEAGQNDVFHAQRFGIGPVYGLYQGRKISGMAGVILYEQETLRHKAALWGVYVSPACRGRGAGRKLIGTALDALPDHVTRISLGVHVDNASAIGLYTALGFEPYGFEKAAFQKDGVYHDETLMVKFR